MVTLSNRFVEVAVQGFKQAFDVALSSDGNVGVSDVQTHKSSILKKKRMAPLVSNAG